jgi:hypothetical protein
MQLYLTGHVSKDENGFVGTFGLPVGPLLRQGAVDVAQRQYTGQRIDFDAT